MPLIAGGVRQCARRPSSFLQNRARQKPGVAMHQKRGKGTCAQTLITTIRSQMFLPSLTRALICRAPTRFRPLHEAQRVRTLNMTKRSQSKLPGLTPNPVCSAVSRYRHRIVAPRANINYDRANLLAMPLQTEMPPSPRRRSANPRTCIPQCKAIQDNPHARSGRREIRVGTNKSPKHSASPGHPMASTVMF